MKMVLCGTIVPPQFETSIKDLSNAGNRFLLNLYKELVNTEKVFVMSYIAVAVEDDVKGKLLQDEKWNYTFKSKRIIGSIIEYNKKVKSQLKDADCLITYNIFYPWMSSLISAKIFKKRSVLILADYSPEESCSSLKDKLYSKLQSYLIKRYDVVVGLSINTKQYVTKKNKFLCIYGGISEEFYNKFDFGLGKTPKTVNGGKNGKLERKIVVMYSGLLSKVTGVDLLIEAFTELSKISDCKLVISGKGDLASYVREKTSDNESIEYLGLMEYDEYIDKLKEADILVNPRNMSLPENKNNFPSKVMEYLATGKPVVSTKFPDYEKFEDYIFFSNSDAASLASTIRNAIDIYADKKNNIYKKNREYSKEFLWSRQCKRIIDAIGD